MPKAALSFEQRKAYKLKYFKCWIVSQMKLTGKTQKDVGDALGLSQGTVSTMLTVADVRRKGNGRRINPDPFSYGQILTLFELFGTEAEERQRLLTL